MVQAESTEQVDLTQLTEERPAAGDEAEIKAILEAIVYVTDEPLSAQQIAAAIGHPLDKVASFQTADY